MSADNYYDYCIIGAGAAGLYAAKKISDKSKKVILCEIGNSQHKDDSFYDLNFKLSGNHQYNGSTKGRSFGIGGTTYLWGASLVPYTKLDFEIEDAYSNYFHKIKKKIIEFNHKKLLETLIGTKVDDTILKKWSLNEYNKFGYYETNNVYIPFNRKDFSKIFLNSLIKLKSNFKFEKFILDNRQEKIEKAIFTDTKNSCKEIIKANNFLLCTGALESVFHINNVIKDMYKNDNDKKFNSYPLNDHLSSPIIEITNQGKDKYANLISKKIQNGYIYGNRYIFKDNLNRGFFHFVVDAEKSKDFDSLRELAYSIQQRRFPNLGKLKFKDTLKGALEYSSSKFLKGELYIPKEAKVFLTYDFECPPSRLRSIEFINKKNRTINWGFDINELENILYEARIKSKILLDSLNLKEGIDYYEINKKIWNPYDAYHPTGILNTPNNEIVLLPSLRFESLQNLYCFSTASLPAPGTANPTYSLLVMIDHSLEELSKS